MGNGLNCYCCESRNALREDQRKEVTYNDEENLEKQTNLSIASQSIIITNKVLNRAGEQNY